MASLKDRIREALLKSQLVKPEDLDRALKEQAATGGDLSKVLVRMKLVNENELLAVLSDGMEIPIVNLARLKISSEAAAILSEEVIKKYQVLPVSRLGDTLSLAMSDPLNTLALDSVKDLTGLTIAPVLCRPGDIQAAIESQFAARNDESFDDILKDIRGGAEEIELVESRGGASGHSFDDISEEAPIIKLTHMIVRQAVMAKASDVFVEPLERHLRIRYRVDGVLQEIDRMSKVLHAPIVSRLKVISNLDISEHRIPQDGRFKTMIDGGREVDFRMSVLPTVHGEKVVLRVLDKSLDRADIDKLGMETANLERIKECCTRPHGLILVCGPTGSGKTTTLYSILKHVDSPEKNIVTVEDPVESQIRGLNQVNIRYEVGLTFTATLRSILRQDPDVIMIGEMRDAETLDIGVKAALTGHLVISSLHTTTAAGSITRMMNMGIEPFLICSSVNGIVAQRLLRKICSRCKEEYKISETLYKKLTVDRILPGKDMTFFRGKGCSQCLKTGYAGRLGIHEILVLTPLVRKMILGRVGEIRIKAVGREEGMRTMREDAMAKAARGLTSLEEVVRVTAADEVAS